MMTYFRIHTLTEKTSLQLMAQKSNFLMNQYFYATLNGLSPLLDVSQSSLFKKNEVFLPCDALVVLRATAVSVASNTKVCSLVICPLK